MLFQAFYNPAWVSCCHAIGRNTLCYYATCTYDTSCTDRDTFEDDAVSTHPDVVLNNYRCRLRTFVGSAAYLIIHWMRISVGYQYTSTNLYIVTNCNAVVNPDACAAHANIIANGKLSSLFYIYSTLQIARHLVHRIARGEVKVISYFQLTPPRLAKTPCLESEGSCQTQRHAPLISFG